MTSHFGRGGVGCATVISSLIPVVLIGRGTVARCATGMSSLIPVVLVAARREFGTVADVESTAEASGADPSASDVSNVEPTSLGGSDVVGGGCGSDSTWGSVSHPLTPNWLASDESQRPNPLAAAAASSSLCLASFSISLRRSGSTAARPPPLQGGEGGEGANPQVDGCEALRFAEPRLL